MPLKITGRVKCPRIRLWRESAMPTTDLRTVRGKAKMSLASVVHHHSPDGIEWGYQGSGPADMALQILAYCLPLGCDGLESVKLHAGKCSQIAWTLHQAFKRSVIANLRGVCMTLQGAMIDAWIDGALQELDEQIAEGERPELERETPYD